MFQAKNWVKFVPGRRQDVKARDSVRLIRSMDRTVFACASDQFVAQREVIPLHSAWLYSDNPDSVVLGDHGHSG